VVARWNQHSQKKEEKCQLFGSTSSKENRRNIALKSGKLSTVVVLSRPNTGSNPVGDANLFKNLRESRQFFAGKKRNSRTARSLRPCVPQPAFPKICRFFS